MGGRSPFGRLMAGSRPIGESAGLLDDSPVEGREHDSTDYGARNGIVRGDLWELYGRQLKALQDKRDVPAKTFPRMSVRQQRKISKCLLKSGKERFLR
jgi:hypothetical protein